ncbi:hypothetical protein D3C84_675450 [compost metagenome]
MAQAPADRVGDGGVQLVFREQAFFHQSMTQRCAFRLGQCGEFVGGLVPRHAARIAHFHDLTQSPHVGKKVNEVAPHHPWRRQQTFDDAVVAGDKPAALEQPVEQHQAIEPEQCFEQGAVGKDRGIAPGLGRDHRHQPHRQQHDKQQVDHKAQQVGDQSATITPQEIIEQARGAPAEVFGALEHDADDPARFLPDRVLQIPREMFAHADHLGKRAVHAKHPRLLERQLRVAHGIASEDALHAFVFEAKTDVVVFGEALDIEGNAVAIFQQSADRLAAEAGADPGAGHLAGQRLANNHVLAMVFGELVNVVSGGEAFPFRGVGVDRNLDQVFARQQVVEKAQFHR